MSRFILLHVHQPLLLKHWTDLGQTLQVEIPQVSILKYFKVENRQTDAVIVCKDILSMLVGLFVDLNQTHKPKSNGTKVLPKTYNV